MSSESRERCMASVASANRCFEREVAVADGVEAVGGDARKAQIARERLAVERKRATGERAGAERANVRAGRSGCQAFGVAMKSFAVREEPVRKQQRLGMLHVRGAGHGNAEILLWPGRQSRGRASRGRCEARARRAFTYMRNSVATISLRLRPVWSLAPSGPSFSISADSAKWWTSSACEASSQAASDFARASISSSAATMRWPSSSVRIPAAAMARAQARSSASS